MDKRETEDETYYFQVGDADLVQAIIDAVAYVTGKDPFEMKPLYDVVDVDSLPALLDQGRDGHVSFQIEGVEVTVTSADEEIIIKDLRETTTLHDQLGDASSVLLLAPDDADETCIELLSAAPPTDETVLMATFTQSAYDRLQVWDTYTTADPAAGTIISMGEFTRSTATDSSGGSPMSPFAIETIEDSTDLRTAGIRISEALDWTDTDTQTVACVHSLTSLLTLVDDETARGFLDALADTFESADVIAHYHLDPTAHDDQTIADLQSRFDAVVEVDDAGDRTVQTH